MSNILNAIVVLIRAKRYLYSGLNMAVYIVCESFGGRYASFSACKLNFIYI